MKYHWYQNSIFYSLDVETFFDSNGDGIGDFQGLIDKLDYLAALGITCIWLLPFFPSPNRDNGYDVKDYYNIDERLGNLGDFAQLIDKAQVYGIKIIIDLVVNHTSIEHPWFREARKDRNSKYRDYYVWSDEPVEFESVELSFQGEENTMWTFDEQAGQYYLHRFYKEQPDLNIMNADVRDEILKIMGFWLSMGVSGFRIDAAAIIIEPHGIKGAEQEELEKFFEEMRHFLAAKKTDAILLAEANVKPEEVATYIKGESRMHMIFNFFLNQYLFLSLAQGKVQPLIKTLRKLPGIQPAGQWLNFLRQHDELNLNLLTDKERQQVFKQFAPDESMQIYGRGIRRRLAPMLDGNDALLKLSYSILLSLPGVPLIRYGDEIGMGDDLSLEGRESVRTPMQWTSEPNAGFSTRAKGRKVIEKGKFGFPKINVLSLQSQGDSILNWIERLFSIRKQCPEIGSGEFEIIEQDNECLFVHHFRSEHGDLWFAHNFSGDPVTFSREELVGKSKKWVHIFGSRDAGEDRALQIDGYGFHWWRSINK
ncbi:alpha-amylase family protein [Longitalea arenae]|uniref:alpha-amylase family protein n=1 Tax=Longitalea arenae TaxID=2812558 RepID=UPI0019673273|nr:alpha-amylase family protein [Longitalea arenae]